MTHDRTVIEGEGRFTSEGDGCAGTLYLPAGAGSGSRRAGLVMGNRFASVRQMYLPEYARAFAAAGLAVLTIDYRFLGDSEGQPRQQVMPETQCDDLRNALTWLAARPEVNAGRLGLWGASFAGGHVLRIAVHDSRVKAVAAQVPALGLWRYLRDGEPRAREAMRDKALAERLDYAATGSPRLIAITAPDGAESVLGAEGYGWHAGNERRHPTFRNEIAAHSLDRILPYDPAAFVEDISPTPMLMIVADRDTTTPTYVALNAFERAGQPKHLVHVDGSHYDVYEDEEVKRRSIAATTEFLLEHLAGSGQDGRHGTSAASLA